MFFILSNLVCHLIKFDQNPSWILNMCLGLAKIYPNGKMDNVSNVDLDDL